MAVMWTCVAGTWQVRGGVEMACSLSVWMTGITCRGHEENMEGIQMVCEWHVEGTWLVCGDMWKPCGQYMSACGRCMDSMQ